TTIGNDIDKAIRLLTQGGLVALPTETVYGLAGNALNGSSVAKIFSVKQRPSFDPLIIHVPNYAALPQWVISIPGKAEKLAEQFWPGPLTLLLPRKPIIPDLVTSGLDTVGVRCPNHPLAHKLLNSIPFPLAAPSANPFGYISPTTPQHVHDQLGGKIPYILDGGECNVGIESTIVGFDEDRVIVYRLGGLSVEKLQSVIGNVEIRLNTSSNPVAPGQLKSHYAPRKKLLVGNLDDLIAAHRSNVAVLSFKDKRESIPSNLQRVLSASGSLQEAAQNLFGMLRELDQTEATIILAEPVPEIDLGRAINDRLKRAAAQ
ncbi:MAG: L-threonylcarbamoyladenylate synthase, partial [Flammeovirgaceae bacterium]